MSWRTVVITQRAKLDFKLGYMVIRTDEIKKVHLSEINILIVESTAVSITGVLLTELTKRKIKVIFCDEKRNPSSTLLPFYGSHDTSGKVREQIAWRHEIKELVWTEIISEKLRKQAEFLKEIGDETYNTILGYVEQMHHYDATNREGHAAKVYFNSLFGAGFTRTADLPINAALNYGYGIILSAFSRVIVSNGYITQLGLFHKNLYNDFNFASDLMEPFRVLVDRAVYDIMPQKFEHEEKIDILKVLNKYVIIDDKKQYVSNAISIYCKSIFEALNGNDIDLIRFYRNEL
ncbi:MAG: type II CRISPR-associated endonuclease Cas1 [Anaerovoracaceae bacterium]